MLINTGLVVNQARPIQMWAKDDDSIRSERVRFWVFPDSAPTTTTTTTSDAVAGVRKIFWRGKDVKDVDDTQYKIVIKFGNAAVTDEDENDPVYVVEDFKSGRDYDSGGSWDFSYTYTPTNGTGDYHYRIVAKDARGSTNRTTGDPIFSF